MNYSFSISLCVSPYNLTGTLVFITVNLTQTTFCYPLLGFTSNELLVAQIYIGSSSISVASGPILSVSPSWTLIVQTWSTTNGLRLYVNNVLVSSVPTATTYVASDSASNYLLLGNCGKNCGCLNGAVSAPGPFSGAIDDWRIYSRELAAVGVCYLYTMV
ncbi:unnamed protein product [Rotaria sordida]|uniref:LamG-like jellyroll fold domain-containing protein n=1 Tax=Rotaria sordida TaxID=392033 RepID=A0A819QDW9_9BILA|nr:unnamed protein product [Rotaria sordida]